MSDLQPLIEAAYADRTLLAKDEYKAAVAQVVADLDQGKFRVATQDSPGKWTTHAWLKQAVLLYFGIAKMERIEVGPFEFYDKIPLKKNLDKAGVRVVPPGTIRYGAFVESGAIVMPGYVNIGAYVGSGTMVDTWATVGSCAQVGKDCHLSGGVGLGGVLEPPGAQPVIVEDGCFIGSRAIIVEGMLVEREAVIGAGVALTASTAIIDDMGCRSSTASLSAKNSPAPLARLRAPRTTSMPLGTSIFNIMRGVTVQSPRNTAGSERFNSTGATSAKKPNCPMFTP